MGGLGEGQEVGGQGRRGITSHMNAENPDLQYQPTSGFKDYLRLWPGLFSKLGGKREREKKLKRRNELQKIVL